MALTAAQKAEFLSYGPSQALINAMKAAEALDAARRTVAALAAGEGR